MHMWRFEVVAEWCSVGFQFSASQCSHVVSGFSLPAFGQYSSSSGGGFSPLTSACFCCSYDSWDKWLFSVHLGLNMPVQWHTGGWLLGVCLLNIVTPSLCSWAQELMFSGLGAVQPLLNLFTFWKLGSELQRYFHFKKPSVKTSVFSKQALAFCLANK